MMDKKERRTGRRGREKEMTDSCSDRQVLTRMTKKQLVQEVLALRHGRTGERFHDSLVRDTYVATRSAALLGTAIYSRTTRFLTVTPMIDKIFGITFSCIAGLEQFTRFRAFRPDGSRYMPHEWPFMRTLVTGEYVRSEEMHIIREDGSKVTLLASSMLTGPNNSGNLLIVFNDITGQKTLAQALQEREEDTRALLDAWPNSSFVIDTNGIVLAANNTMAANHGMTRAELIGRRIYDLHPEALAKMLRSHHEEAIRTRKPVRFELERRGRLFESTVYPIIDEADRVRRLIVHSYDITERKQVERRLRESEERLSVELGINRRLQEISSQLIGQDNIGKLYAQILDVATTIMRSEYASIQMFYPERGAGGELRLLAFREFADQAAKLWEWVGTESAGSTCRAVLREGRRVVVEDVEKCGYVQGTEDLAMFRQNGIRSCQTTPLFSRSGKIVGMISTYWREPHEPSENDLRLFDVLARQAADLIERNQAEETLRNAKEGLERQVQERTEELQRAYYQLLSETEQRRNVEEQLLQSQKMEALGTMAGGIAHDFNNMLAVILGNAELALDEVDSGTNGIGHQIGQIMKASKRASDLVKQILAFSRKSKIQRNPVKLTPLMEETVRLLRGSLPSTIDIKVDFRTDADTVLADFSQVQQVLMNLAANAAHAMSEDGGTLSIGLADASFREQDPRPDTDMQPGRYVVITVSDTGTGIPKKLLSRIFEPFFTTKEAGQGTGMGLAVVFGIVKSHGGAITVESRVGKGSTFRIFIPADDETAQEETAKQGSLPRGTERLLVVDDEPFVVDVASETLKRLGYDVTTAEGGPEGWKKFKVNPEGFDLVITDHVMPEMTGMRLAEKMLEVRKDIPIILFTGYSETVVPEKAKVGGVSEVLIKPVVARELAETVRRVLDRRHSANK